MTPWLADIFIFMAGACVGGVAVYSVGFRLIQQAVDEVIADIVKHGYFMRRDVRYEVVSTQAEGTKH